MALERKVQMATFGKQVRRTPNSGNSDLWDSVIQTTITDERNCNMKDERNCKIGADSVSNVGSGAQNGTDVSLHTNPTQLNFSSNHASF